MQIVGFLTRRLPGDGSYLSKYPIYQTVLIHYTMIGNTGHKLIVLPYEPPRGKPTMWFPNRSDTNRPVQSQKQARSLKFWIYKVEELYYPCSENKGADQLRSYCEADLRLCFRLCRLLVFPYGGSYFNCNFHMH